MNEYNMAKRRLKTLEAHAEQVLALKQKDVDVAKAALASLGEEDMPGNTCGMWLQLPSTVH